MPTRQTQSDATRIRRILNLAREAAAAGDAAQVERCAAALDGDPVALAECAAHFAKAEAWIAPPEPLPDAYRTLVERLAALDPHDLTRLLYPVDVLDRAIDKREVMRLIADAQRLMVRQAELDAETEPRP